jgi:hypothetical protein
MTAEAAGPGGTQERKIVIDGYCQKVIVTIDVDGTCSTTTGGTNGAGGGPQGGPIATPYLVISSGPSDSGARPLPVDQALRNQSIQAQVVVAPGGASISHVQLSCSVANLGAVPSSAALIEFYIGAELGVWNPGHATLTPAQVQAATQLVGRAGFVAPPGATTTVMCPVLWNPQSAEDARQGVLVQVTDLFTDRITAPFDAFNDRHVARADDLMDPILE